MQILRMFHASSTHVQDPLVVLCIGGLHTVYIGFASPCREGMFGESYAYFRQAVKLQTNREIADRQRHAETDRDR